MKLAETRFDKRIRRPQSRRDLRSSWDRGGALVRREKLSAPKLIEQSITSEEEVADKVILFLDIDGVLNSEQWYHSMGLPPNPPSAWLDPACVARLDALARETGASLVLSSSWRLILGVEKTAAALAACGLTVPLVGETPECTYSSVEVDRWSEIRAWLDSHPEVTRWGIVDDLPLVGVPDGRLVQTSIAVGLTDADCARLRAVLQGTA